MMSKKPSNKSKPKKQAKSKKSNKGKRVLSLVALTLLIGLGVLTAIRWNAWFGNKPEANYRTLDTIDRITIVPGSKFTSERTITWRCGETLQGSWLEYGLAGNDTTILERRWLPASGLDVHSRSGHGCFYQARIYGLQEGRTYRYRLHTGVMSSERYSFTIPYSEKSTDFVYIGDVQDPTGDMAQDLLPRLPILVPRIDFLAVGGDQIEGPSNDYWDAWYKGIGNWSREVAIVAATGNHEYLKKGFMRELDPRWTATYAYPKNGPEDFESRSYYIDLPLCRYIVMDTNGINSPIDIAKHRLWLSEALRTSSQVWQIVMFHHAVYNVREGRIHPVMRYVFKGILESEGADLVLQGHDHAYSRITTKTEQGEKISPMYVVSSSSPKLYRNGFDEIHDRLGSGLQLYQRITLTQDSLHYRSYEYDGTLYDDVVLRHQKDKGYNIAIDKAQNIDEKFLFNAFGSGDKGQKRATQYQTSIREYLKHKQQLQ